MQPLLDCRSVAAASRFRPASNPASRYLPCACVRKSTLPQGKDGRKNGNSARKRKGKEKTKRKQKRVRNALAKENKRLYFFISHLRPFSFFNLQVCAKYTRGKDEETTIMTLFPPFPLSFCPGTRQQQKKKRRGILVKERVNRVPAARVEEEKGLPFSP